MTHEDLPRGPSIFIADRLNRDPRRGQQGVAGRNRSLMAGAQLDYGDRFVENVIARDGGRFVTAPQPAYV